MNVNSIDQISQLSNITSNKANSDSGSVFSKLYHSAIDTLEETNSLQKEAEQMSLDFALGKIDNVHDVMIAQEKATVALQYTVQIRDKALAAYNEIMRMQV